MKKFKVKFVREFEVDIEVDTPANARAIADKILAQFPPDTTRVLSVIAEDYVEQPCEACKEEVSKGSKPNGPKPDPSGGSPQTPALPVAAELVDQIAAAA